MDEDLDEYFQKHNDKENQEGAAMEQSEVGDGEYAEFNDNPEEKVPDGAKANECVRKVNQVQISVSTAPDDVKE